MREEQRVEAFYKVTVTGNLRLTGNLNYTEPGEATRQGAMFGSSGLQESF